VSLTVTNTGSRSGRHTVLLFAVQDYRYGVSPEKERLVGFTQVTLDPDESALVTLRVETSQLSYSDEYLNTVVESGEYRLQARSLDLEVAEEIVTVTALAPVPFANDGSGGAPSGHVYGFEVYTPATPWVLVIVGVAVTTACCLAVGAALALRVMRSEEDKVPVKRNWSGTWVQMQSRMNSRNTSRTNLASYMLATGGATTVPRNASHNSLHMHPTPVESAELPRNHLIREESRESADIGANNGTNRRSPHEASPGVDVVIHPQPSASGADDDADEENDLRLRR